MGAKRQTSSIFINMTERFGTRKTIPNGDRGSKTANCEPDRPPITTSTFALEPALDQEAETLGRELTVINPITPHKVTDIGGKRTIGGGRSPEAMRRARKKAGRKA
jgi:hypothetical protein